jgi:P4 family phage/plasmid primase-like protien
MSFNKYLESFEKDTEDPKSLTHLAFRGKGKYKVSDEKYDEFYKQYYNALIKSESLYLIEKINENCKFAFFLDIETPKKNTYKIKINDIKTIIDKSLESIEEMFESGSCIKNYIISRRNNKYHINFPKLIVNTIAAQKLSKTIIENLSTELKKLIDTSVYRTGLRIFGSKKSEVEIKKEKELFDGEDYSSVYEIYDIDNNELFNIEDIEYSEFIQLVIRRKNDIQLSKVKDSFKQSLVNTNTNTNTNTNISIKGVENKNVSIEISKLFSYLKDVHSENLQDYNFNISRIVATQNKQGIFCYYISLHDKICPFVCREHNRNQSPIYVEINTSGVYIKCYDQDCLRRKFPDEGFNLPENFESEYPELYLSMTTKYWKADIDITPEIKILLEDSLSGSHYKIAKVIYNIYKHRFRIDDIKNPDWYEFDGIRWSKTHIMNILISEELQKYYKGIKISDTGALQNSDLQEFIQNKDKLEANLRNSLVDNIINKLENVSFKKNIMTEMYYLFKSLEPNFVSKLDASPYLIGFKNGIYDLEDMTFRCGEQKDYLTLTTGYDFIEYDPNALEVQEIYGFLRQIIPNEKVFKYLLKILGRSLLGINDEHFYIFTGLSGANGKSTLINFLEYTLGDYITSADVSLLTNNRAMSSSASPDIIRLKGRRLVSFAEPEYGDTLKTGIIKAFSGGDSIIARELYKAPISFKLQASMFMCCNDLPNISSIDGGSFRRLRIVEFKSRFCDTPIKQNEFKIDPTIKDKIKNWRPYFMSILIHYLELYQEELRVTGKIEEPEEVKIATNKYKADNDKFNDYITECLVEIPDRFENIKTIYNNFMRWWAENYSNTRTPDIKELRKSLKIKYGEEVEKFSSHGIKQIGFNVKFNVTENDIQNNDEEDY